MAERTPLEEEVRARIAREGPLSFRDVMQAALYHPEHGYYTNLRGFGPEGDFITSPERHPAFGWLLGRQALDAFEALGRPEPFRVLELGAGSGALAESLTACLRQVGVTAFTYTLDEVSPSLRQVQQSRLRGPEFRWDHTDEPAHFIVANEVADALPVHRATVRPDGLFHELRVGTNETGALSWVVADEPHAGLEAYFADLHYRPQVGAIVDVCLDLGEWVKSIAQRLEHGVGLVTDYAASPPRDSLLTYYRHTMGSDPLVRLGQQDLSAHVDLRTLVRLAIAQGLRAGATAQRGLLLNLGIARVQTMLTRQTDREALAQLVDPDGMGGQIATVFLLRGMPAGYRPAGAVGRDWPEPQGVPSLPPSADEAEFLSQWRDAFGDSQEEE